MPAPAPALRLLRRCDVAGSLRALAPTLMDAVRAAYVAFGEGRAANPHSLFLAPPPPAAGRAIALPASLCGDSPAMGLKWISSFPANVALGLERASAVIVVNDPCTGYPVAVMEGALISAWRTALSAALACGLLAPSRSGRALAVVGCGVIAARTLLALQDDGWAFDAVHLFDLSPERALAFAGRVETDALRAVVHIRAEEAVAAAEVAVFATTAAKPWFGSVGALSHAPTMLHLSLRDLDPALILASQNFTDDVDHATRAGTSLELASHEAGGPDFIAGDMHALISGRSRREEGRTAVFSPFGLGVLDIAIASRVAAHAAETDLGLAIDDFHAA